MSNSSPATESGSTFQMPSGIPGVPPLLFVKDVEASGGGVVSYRSRGFDAKLWLRAKRLRKKQEQEQPS